MNVATAQSAYRSQAVETAGPAQLVLMLYDGVLASIAKARIALQDKPVDIGTAHRELTKAQAGVAELAASLNHEDGGQIADSLGALYGFCLERLVKANVEKDDGPLAGVEAVLSELRDAWKTVCIPKDLVG